MYDIWWGNIIETQDYYNAVLTISVWWQKILGKSKVASGIVLEKLRGGDGKGRGISRTRR
jgi:hypothetical protein